VHSFDEIPRKGDAGSITDGQENRVVLRLDAIPARTGPGSDCANTELGLDSLRKAMGLFEGHGLDLIHDRAGFGLFSVDVGSGV
jgi:hypothetical protein